MHKTPTSPKICPSTTVGNLKWVVTHIKKIIEELQTRLVEIVSKIVRRVESHARNVRLQRVPRSQMSTNRNDTSRTSGQI